MTQLVLLMPSFRLTEIKDANHSFPDRLLDWWDQHGRKSLPWKTLGTAYGFWIAEVMLQQTQVTTVKPYFSQFLTRFPDLSTLAAASQDDVLALWSGLGYYSRARNLHRAANICMQEHHGQLPDDPILLEALPGIGHSTANAIVSQSTDRVLAILDGNVKRVLARHAGVSGWPGQAKIAKQLWALAEQRLPAERGADYTQASMDLGALLCTRTKPACIECPIQADCFALHNDQVDQLPSKKPKTKKTEQTIDMLLVSNESGQVLLQRRPPAGIWGGLWCLPEGKPDQAADHLPVIAHELTHRSLLIKPWLTNQKSMHQIADSDASQWYTIEQSLALGLPQPIRKLLQELK